jgi:hypothetical protein
MQQKFGDDLSRANQRWGTSFYSWNNVAPPNQGQNAGAMWSDALLWYRDTKRHMITEQIAQAKTLISQYSMMHRPDTILLVPGKHLPGDAIDAAAKRAGVDNEEAIVMPDTDFMIDMASVFNCELQYTASQNDQEVKYLVSAVRSKDIRTHIWGENAGGHPSLNPAHLVEVSIKNRLFGFEYINAEPLFDGQTSSKTGFFSVFAKSIRHLRMAFSNGTTSE